MSIEVTMKFKKSTKGTHVFEQYMGTGEPGDPVRDPLYTEASIPVLYIRKGAMEIPAKKIKVIVTVVT